MRDLRELGLSLHGEPITTPPPTGRQLALVERLVGVPLPPAYVALLRFSNGGYPRVNTFYIERDGQREPWTVGNFFNVASDSLATEDPEDVVWEYQYGL